MSLAMLANLVILFADSPNRMWYLCAAVSLTLIITAAVIIARACRKRPPPYQPQLVRTNGNTWVNPNFPRPKPVENEQTRRKDIQSLRRQLNTRDKTIDSLRYRIHHAEAEREREHQSALRQLSHRVKEADASIEMRQVYWNEWQKERLKSAELEIALDNLRRGNTHRQITRERDAAQRDAHRAEISEKEAQRKLAKLLAKAESLKEDAEMAWKEAREVELFKAMVEEKNGSLERELKKTKEAAEQVRLESGEKIKQLESRLQQAIQENKNQLYRANAAEKRAEAAEKTHDDLAAKNITVQQVIEALEVKKNELGASGLQGLRAERDRLEKHNAELNAAVQDTSRSNEQLKSENGVTSNKNKELQTMLEAASEKNKELSAVRKGLVERIESLETEKASLIQQVQYPQNNGGDNEIIRQQNGLLSETIEEMKRQYHTDMDGVKARAEALAGQVTALQAANNQLTCNLNQRVQEVQEEQQKTTSLEMKIDELKNVRGRLISKEQATREVAEEAREALEQCKKELKKRLKAANELGELNRILLKEKADLKAQLEDLIGDEIDDESQDQDGYQPQYTNNPAFRQNDYPSGQYDAFGCDRGSQSTYPPQPQDNYQANTQYQLPGLGQSSASTDIPDLGGLEAIAQWNAANPQQESNGGIFQSTAQTPNGGEVQSDFPGVHEYVNATPEQEKQKYGDPTFDWNNVDPSLLQGE